MCRLKKIGIIAVCGIVLLGVMAACSHVAKPERNYRSFSSVQELYAYMRWHPEAKPLISAHRGGPQKGFPENAIETFSRSLEYAPCIIECDVRRTLDGKLVMLHGPELEKTTTGKGRIEEQRWSQLRQLHLKDPRGAVTEFRIPTFAGVLKWARGRAVLNVDIKGRDVMPLVIDEIFRLSAESYCVVITYNLEEAAAVHRLAPEIMISVSASSVKTLKKVFELGIPDYKLCCFVGVYEPRCELYDMLHKRKIRAILGTMHNLDRKAARRGASVYQGLYARGADILSTDNVPLTARAVRLLPANFRKKARK